MYKKILVPLDGSELAECVLPHVKMLAGGLDDTQITFLYVVSPVDAPMVDKQFKNKIEAEACASAKLYLKKLCAKAVFKDKANGQVVLGHPADAIIDFSTRNKMDMIIMATHGRSGVKRWLYGSVAEKVVHSSKIPIWLVKASGCNANYRNKKLKIVAPLDGSKVAESVLPHIENLSSQLPQMNLDITLVRVSEVLVNPASYPPPMPMHWEEYISFETKRSKEICDSYLKDIQTKLTQSGLHVKKDTPVGTAADVLISYVREKAIDLVIICTHGRTGISKLAFGSIAEKLLIGVDCPVLLIRAK